ncbi:penicillin-binding protein 1A [Cohaesibacter celericrescens]|uniref:Penicillin-binding protein 1A n=1 Tax=Cohaesibacter celericrescens TaxID=2067669 RepID=A0A2N5XT90_9HYPH|nr:penicillin-binding protein 1A [Cohaesibacter celericrescens]PLW77713.1 penicillin-binding protein [Cohaesibacter celericrescens]
MWRFFGFLFAAGSVMFVVVAMAVYVFLNSMMQGLPDFTALRNYEPPVMTRIHAADGQLMAEYARQRRLFLPIQAIPDKVKQAFLSAEDKNFYEHAGIDFLGIGRAVFTNIKNYGSNRRPVGASTITQQVAKNFLLTSEQSYERKIKEALLSMRIEQTFSKDEILELYLNEIFFGIGSYGIGSAALHYFDKSVHELTLAEIGYLAALPKAPNNYHPIRRTEKAIERRNWVIDQMVNNGYVSVEEANQAKASDLQVTFRTRGAHIFAADYFAEEVRRWIDEEFGEEKLYNGGLSVRTTLNVPLQVEARKALNDGLIKFDRTKGWRGPVATSDISGDWGSALAKVKPLSDIPEWKLAVVLSAAGKDAAIGVRPEVGSNGAVSEERATGVIPLSDLKWAKWAKGDLKGKAVKDVSTVLKPGDVVYVSEKKGGVYSLQQVPEVSGALIAMDPFTGRVLAIAGGFSYAQSQFNRATQAYRQPGSSFKPFVYATALDNGYSPSSVVMDAPIEIQQGGGQGLWKPQNYGGKFYGPSTLRLGIEKSRNVMTVRLAKDMGMPLVAEYAQRFGIYDDLMPVLSMALGAGETTVMRMATAYSMLANGGRRITPTFVDRVQDRYGKTIYRHDARICQDCNVQSWNYQDVPVIVDNREQVLDPMTAYQITSMMEGVVLRGTAPIVREVGKPIAGKTGTTNDERDAWFVGYSPDLVVGVYVGYDRPRPMGRAASGGHLAAPIFTEFMKVALKDHPKKPFPVPEGLQLIPIDRRTGLRASASSDGGVILEAFKPGTTPPDSYSVIGFTEDMGRPVSAQEAEQALTQGTGGLY